MDKAEMTAAVSTGPGDRLRAIVSSPYIWGGLATFAFYRAIPCLGAYRELAERYFCAHPVEYVQTALFFVGFAILLRKLIGLRSQRSALQSCLARAGSAPVTRPSVIESQGDAAWTVARTTLGRWISQLTGGQRRSAIAERLAGIQQYLQQQPDADAVESQLKDLEDRAGDDLHDSYALLQTINWAIPIMGFLGTVLGITMAIANLDVNQLDSSLSAVTFNLAVAFDTTAVALCHSLILVFLYLFVKQSEERVFLHVGAFCRRHVLPLIPDGQRQASPLFEAETAAARQLVDRTGQLIDAQTRLWSESVEALRERWTGTLDAQQQSLAQALAGGTRDSLAQHADHLAGLRSEFLQALDRLSQQRVEAEAALRTQEAALVGRWEAGTEKLATVLDAAQQAADERTSRMLAEVAAQVDGWKQGLEAATGALEGHVERLIRQEAALCELLERGSDIVSLERGLTDNLQALRAAETFEQTMHSLSAAVHLLTAHARQRAA